MLQTDMDIHWTPTARSLALPFGVGHFLHSDGALRFIR